MATGRKKASTRVRAGQEGTPKRKTGRKKVQPPKGGRRAPKRPVKRRPPKTVPKAQKRRKAPARAVPKARKLKKTPPRGKPKARQPKAQKPRKRSRETRLVGAVKRAEKRARASFQKLRKTALKQKKLILPLFPKKKGRTPLRGVKGPQRDLTIKQFWEDIREIWLETWVMQTYESLHREFTKPPSMYGRFTFTVSNVKTLMTMGSPKVMRGTKKKVKHWFIAIPLAYTLEGARFQFQKTFDNITKEIGDARHESPNAEFFLEFITLIAYEVDKS